MAKTLLKLFVLLLASVLALGLAEAAARMIPVPRLAHHHEDANHEPLDLGKGVAAGNIGLGLLPRNRALWTREHAFYLCYDGKQRPYMDERGCVRVDINKYGLRDDLDLEESKPDGETRVLCLGDSFTFGWGVSNELVWPRLIEPELQPEPGASKNSVRVVNCGASGTLLLDECFWGLRDRFEKFGPDVVVQSICLNDLVPMPDVLSLNRIHALRSCDAHHRYVRLTCEDCVAELHAQESGWLTDNSVLWQRLTGYGSLDSQLVLDPSVDWGQWLLDLPEDWIVIEDPKQRNFYGYHETPVEAVWKGGGPQQALRDSAQWCKDRGVAYGVVIWPLFQGLEDHYPFETLHRVVREECDKAGIEVLDLLPSFEGQTSSELWVDPSDMHGNEVAHQIATAPIAEFVSRLLER